MHGIQIVVELPIDICTVKIMNERWLHKASLAIPLDLIARRLNNSTEQSPISTPFCVKHSLPCRLFLIIRRKIQRRKNFQVESLPKKKLPKEARTADFMPPEVLFGQPVYSTAMDIFSFACLCAYAIS